MRLLRQGATRVGLGKGRKEVCSGAKVTLTEHLLGPVKVRLLAQRQFRRIRTTRGKAAPRRRIEAEATAQGVRRVCFLTYDFDQADIERAAGAEGFVFLQYSPGLTGLRDDLDPALSARLRRLRQGGVARPIVAGIGVSTPDQMRHALDAGADGIVVGSMTVLKALEGPAALEEYLMQTRAVVDGG